MMKAFTVALTTSFQNVYNLISAVSGSTPQFGILPKKVCLLTLITPASGGASGVTLGDSNFANTSASITFPFTVGPFDENVINLLDYYLAASTPGNICVIIESV